MPGPSTLPRGNISLSMMLGVTLSPTSVANATSAEQTFTVNGLLVGDAVSAKKPTAQAGLSLGGSRVSAANTLAITFVNSTAATITPTASEQYIVEVNRAENYPSLPSAIA